MSRSVSRARARAFRIINAEGSIARAKTSQIHGAAVDRNNQVCDRTKCEPRLSTGNEARLFGLSAREGLPLSSRLTDLLPVSRAISWQRQIGKRLEQARIKRPIAARRIISIIKVTRTRFDLSVGLLSPIRSFGPVYFFFFFFFFRQFVGLFISRAALSSLFLRFSARLRCMRATRTYEFSELNGHAFTNYGRVTRELFILARNARASK